jgi:hypothetical protein
MTKQPEGQNADGILEFTEAEISQFELATGKKRTYLFMIVFWAIAIVFAGTAVTRTISSFAYIEDAGVTLDRFANLSMMPNSTYKGALCLARENMMGALYWGFLSATMIVLIMARRRQVLLMKKTLRLIEREKMRGEREAR